MTWNNALPSVGQTAWGTPLDNVIQEVRDRIEAIEAAGQAVAGVTGISVDGSTYVAGQVNLSTSLAPLVHFHAGTDITSGTIPIARLSVANPVVIIKAVTGPFNTAGNWPASRASITSDANRCIIFIGNSDPGLNGSGGLMNNDVDQYIITS